MNFKLIFASLFLLIGTLSQAQLSAPALSLEYEEVAIDPAVLPEIEAQIGSNPRCVQVYLRLPEFWECQAIFGDMTGALDISSTTSFYQNEFGGPTTLNLSAAELLAVPSTAYDSWLTIGATDSTNNFLQLIPGEAGFSNFEAGGNIFINDILGTLLIVPSDVLIAQNTIDANGRILISQFTTAGDIQACYNFQVRLYNSDGTIYNPPGSEQSLVYQFRDECIFIPAPSSEPQICDMDFDNNGFIGVSDLQVLLTRYGCQSNCETDINGDGDTGLEEILFFLIAFGNTCD